MQNAMRVGLPVAAVAAILWTISQVTYSAGAKVNGSETQIAALTARLEASERAHETKEHDMLEIIGKDHDAITELKTKDENMAKEWDNMQKDLRQPIEFNVKDSGGKK